MNEFYIGDVVTLSSEIKNKAGAFADPSDITLTIKLPDGSLVVYTMGDLAHTALGKFEIDYLIESVGTHTYRFKGTGSNAGVGIDKFVVVKDPLEE